MRLKALALLCVLGGALPQAYADTGGDEEAQDRLVLPKYRVAVDVFFNIVLDESAKPFSISPDIYYGLTDKLTVGMVHSSEGISGFMGVLRGTSLCVDGKDNGCQQVYNSLGLSFRYAIPLAGISLALDGGPMFTQFDPDVLLSLKIGADLRWRKGKLAVEAAPAFFLALTNRSRNEDLLGDVTTNPDIFSLPLSAFYTVIPKLSVALQFGIILPFEDTGDSWRLPISVGAFYQITDHCTLMGAFSLPRIAGGSSEGATDERTLTFGAIYAL